MAIWPVLQNGVDEASAAQQNLLQAEKLDRDGQVAATGAQQWKKGADVASAATLTPGNDGNYFDVTGSVTITAISMTAVGGAAVQAGTVVRLHFDAALTITHHATNLVLPRGESIKTVAGSELEFTKYESGWRCTKIDNFQAPGIYARDYGAVGDASTDDTAAIQAAVDACLVTDPPAPLYLTGRYRLVDHVHINRPVDTKNSDFRIIALGAGSGFYKDSIATSPDMFSSTLGILSFNSGSVEPAAGEVLTGATSGRTAIVVSVNKTAGTWGGGDAVGTIKVSSYATAFSAENINGSIGGANILTCLDGDAMPSSEFINFEGVYFEGSAIGLGAYVLDGEKFLRVKFTGNCRFEKMRLMKSTSYAQTIYVHEATIRSVTGAIMDIAGSADVSLRGLILENIETIFKSHHPTFGNNGFRFMDNVCEWTTETPILADGLQGAQITGNYFEGIGIGTTPEDTVPILDFETGASLVSQGVSFTGNIFNLHGDQLTAAGYRAVKWGHTTQINSSGNFSTSGKLHDCSVMTDSEWAGFSSIASAHGTALPPAGKAFLQVGNAIFGGAVGDVNTWIPVPTNLTINGGGTPTYAGSYTKIGNIVHCYLRITVAGGTCTSSAGSTKFTLPYAPSLDSISQTVDMGVFYGAMLGVVSAANNAVYPGAWTTLASVLVTFWYMTAV